MRQQALALVALEIARTRPDGSAGSVRPTIGERLSAFHWTARPSTCQSTAHSFRTVAGATGRRRRGVYLSGLPLSAPSMTLWGQLQLVASAAMAAGTALVVAGRAGALYRKGTLRIDISHSNEDDFIKNLLRVRVEERVAFATYKPTGFASVTGLVTP